MRIKILTISLGLAAGCAVTAWGGPPRGIVAPWFDDTVMIDNRPGGILIRGVGPGIQAGADHIVAQQCAIGGFCWPHGSACCPNAPVNITGSIYLGLLNAYSYTGDPAHLAAAVAGGDYDIAWTFPNATPGFGSFAPGALHALSAVSSDPNYSNHAATGFFDRLTAGTYGDAAYDPTYYPCDTYGYLARHKAARSGYTINLRPWDMQYMPWVAGSIGNATSGIDLTVDGTDQDGDGNDGEDAGTQQNMFLTLSLLDGLNTLNDTDPNNVPWDLTGLAGAVHGLALNGTTSFPAIASPNCSAINGITTLGALADVLAGYQNANGSWYWASNLSSPGASDEDTQNTAYAVMALVVADPLVASDYSTEIADGRDWLRSMQLPDGGFLGWPGGSENTEVEAEALSALAPDTCAADKLEFVLASGSDCVRPTEIVTVELWQTDLAQLVRGFQAFAQFDSSAMTHGSNTFTSTPYALHILNSVSGDNIDLAAGIDDFSGQPTTMADALLVTLTFTAGSVEGPTTVSFRYHQPPSRFTDVNGAEVLPCLVQSPTIIIDGTAPVFDQSCPLPPITVNADAGTCEASGATVSPTMATATDNLDPSPTVNFARSDGKPNLTDPYEAVDSPITITWTATDCAGNFSTCQQVVTVNALNELVVNVQLGGTVNAGPFTRCITFELWDCPGTSPAATVADPITFTNGSASNVTVLVPCGVYDCITARDTLHTLRRTDDDGDFAISGTQYVADFTSSGTTDDSLVGGNLNDDFWIDILDFGVFSSQWGTTPGADTDCSTVGPHADIDGSGTVWTEDFTFISNNFLLGHEANCCGQPGLLGDGGNRGPITEISVGRLRAMGLDELASGDLNGDGWLDEADVVAFMQGARPRPGVVPVEDVMRSSPEPGAPAEPEWQP